MIYYFGWLINNSDQIIPKAMGTSVRLYGFTILVSIYHYFFYKNIAQLYPDEKVLRRKKRCFNMFPPTGWVFKYRAKLPELLFFLISLIFKFYIFWYQNLLKQSYILTSTWCKMWMIPVHMKRLTFSGLIDW